MFNKNNKSQILVIINGSGGKGKDTFIDYIDKYIEIRNISSITPVKEAVFNLLSYESNKSIHDVNKDEKFRKLLSDIKKSWIEYDNGAYKYIKNRVLSNSIINYKADNCPDIIFIHIREPEEIKKITSDKEINHLFSIETLLVDNENVKTIKSNDSDKNVYEFEYDYIVNNNSGKYQLANKSLEYIKYLNEKYNINLL